MKNLKHGDEMVPKWSYLKKHTYRFRTDPVPGGGSYNHSSCCGRAPRVNNQLRANIEAGESGFKVRFSRTLRGGLPESWDHNRDGRWKRGKGWKRSKKKSQWM